MTRLLTALGVVLALSCSGKAFENTTGNNAGGDDASANGTSNNGGNNGSNSSNNNSGSDASANGNTGDNNTTNSGSIDGGNTGSNGGVSDAGAPAGPCPGTTVGCVIDFAGAFGALGNSVDGTGTQARFRALGDITGWGNFLYVTDGTAVRRIDIRTAAVTTFSGAINVVDSYVEGPAAVARFAGLAGIDTDGAYLYVADSLNFVVRKVSLESGATELLAGTPGVSGNVNRNANDVTPARFEHVRGVTFDGNHLFVTQIAANNTMSGIRRVDPGSGAVVTLFYRDNGLVDGNLANAKVSRPRNILAISTAALLIADTENHRIRGLNFSDTPSILTRYGSVAGHQDGTHTNTEFRRLRGMDSDGEHVYVADSDNFVIRKITMETDAVETIAGSPGVNTHQVGIGSEARFNKPMDVFYHEGTGDLFIVEDHVIRRMYLD